MSGTVTGTPDIEPLTLTAEFGDLVARCVAILSDPPGADRATRKAESHAKLAKVEGEERIALVVKAADRLANLREGARVLDIAGGTGDLAMAFAKKVGASKLALLGAAIGSVAGIFFGLVGIFIFPFIGAIAGELIARRELGQAAKAGLATWLGLLFGALAKLALALTMLGVFVIAYFM